MNRNLRKIPLIDLETVAPSDLVGALERASCVLLAGHGIDASLRERVLSASDAFFALPRSRKAEAIWPGDGPWYGWQPVNESSPTADLMERFEVRLPARADRADAQRWADHFAAWPDEPADFRPAWTALYAALHGLAARVMGKVAEGLGREGDDLRPWQQWQHSNLVANYYHAQSAPPDPRRTRAKEHSDMGGITLLWADQAPGGLEVELGARGNWLPVAMPADCWLLQVGDLLHLWSEERIPANRHRVVNPPPGQGLQARRSIAFFHHPSPEVVVTPARDERSRALTAGDYIPYRLDAELQVGQSCAPGA